MDKVVKYLLGLFVAITLIDALLLPPFDFISLNNLLFPLATIGILIAYKQDKLFWISASLIGLIVISSLLSNYVNNGITKAEFIWSIRWVKLFTIGWSTYFVFQNNRKMLSHLLFMGFIGVVVINALQLIGIPSVIDLYSSKEAATVSLTKSLLDGRVFGSVLNPNNNGLLLSLFAVYFLTSNVRWKYLLVSISGLLILMTQSRTAFIALVLVIGVLIIIHLWKKSKRHLLLFGAGSLLVLFALIQLKFNNLSSLFDGSAFRSNSVNTRFDVANKVFEVNAESHFLGQGKLANIPELVGGSIDNEFMYVYLQYGFIGILALCTIVVLFSVMSIKPIVSRGSLGMIIVMLICGLTNLSFSNLEIGSIFILLFVASLASSSIDSSESVK